ncbi:MAG: hypothetical protein HKN21_08755 [Candidatus Eisenbacteria bacterium]|uniref:Carbohydrate-binding domain-containing protein n=1 Tax=Eiseniibacteriota bacterium TaxID=2212470 RepID=A0A7Y2EF00_UNCEI|nr:hypothetical protein [Candidatus Eisenbacteria bacterium]
MLRTLTAIVLAVIFASPALAGAPLSFGLHSETMDGTNNFPAGSHLQEALHSAPYGSCGGTDSDLHFESSAYHYFVASGSFVDTPLPSGGCMDIRQVYVSWDATNMYIGIEGPNELWVRGDLFIAIDTDNATGAAVTSSTVPWLKAVDFAGWDPEYFVALESPTSGGGYAALLDAGLNVVRDTGGGLLTADSGYISCDVGGMYYEFGFPLSDIGVTYGSGQVLNLAVYTTYEDDNFDTYDSGPGCGQTIVHEELGDYPYDGDHCGANLDPVSGANDPSCGFAESDDALPAGVGTSGRFPASDNSPSDIDTIAEYYCITNFAQEPPTAVEPKTWGQIKRQINQRHD